MNYRQLDSFDLPSIERDILEYWTQNQIFNKSIETRDENNNFVFYEGPPSANGLPGIHHVIGRSYKDIFCRYKTLQGYRVNRKGGWDTHGLPVELKVESELGISKEDIGTKITIEDYNLKCKETVMQFKTIWEDLTNKMGFWLDLKDPYITYDNDYIESVWYIIKEINQKNLLYKGYTIQPYSPAAGTGLSTHELNQTGTYRDITDTTAVAVFGILDSELSKLNKLFDKSEENYNFIAWTTTPWTLPSNTALALGKNINYTCVKSFNPYTHQKQVYILATDLLFKWFKSENQVQTEKELIKNDQNIPYMILGQCKGSDLNGINYNQLMEFEANSSKNIKGEAFKTILGEFVTTTDGTGIVHIAPSFGADDRKVAAENGIGELLMVDKEGKFIGGMGFLSNRFVKDYRDEKNYKAPDIDIVIWLKENNKAFNVQKYIHSYPHCWRTDKPIIYYPLDSWFVKTTAIKDRLIKNNNQINWKPKSTGTGRFGQWLENIQDWNLSRSRFWGIPLPVWANEDKSVYKVIGSIAELKEEIAKANESIKISKDEIAANKAFLTKMNTDSRDLHKPYIDTVVLFENGEKLVRESDVIDVWFDSGSMPYAQWGYPFKNQEKFKNSYPADFIAEGVDQTRGWFYTLHVISTILFDQPAYNNVISNGLALDAKGEKMSKRKGNVIEPFDAIKKYGADAVRWYIVSNSVPWENIKFDLKGVEEARRRYFGTLYNTYSFFALYANIDKYKYNPNHINSNNELDKWILSKLNSLIKEVEASLEKYETLRAIRAIDEFVNRNLSNWYVRLSRRRFWKNDQNDDKLNAYNTLYKCLLIVSKLSSPFAPFFSDWLYQSLASSSGEESVHLSLWPKSNDSIIDSKLESRIQLAQDITSMILSLRKQEQIKVRQPLSKIIIPIIKESDIDNYKQIEEIVKSEVNIKEIEYVLESSGLFSKKAKPVFKILGKKLGKDMSSIGKIISEFDDKQISELEQNKTIPVSNGIVTYDIALEEVEITTDDMEGFLVASDNGLTLALDITITEDLKVEGLAREFINRVQNYRKDNNYKVDDFIRINIKPHKEFDKVVEVYGDYICSEVLCKNLIINNDIDSNTEMELNGIKINITINNIN